MKPRIFLVEDCAVTRFGLVSYFSRDGYQFSEAATVAEASTAMAKEHFDAVILDINLPDGDGLDFIEFVRTVDATVPIIIITGAGDIPLAVKAMQSGADNFLTKPIDMHALSLFLHRAIEIGQLKRQALTRRQVDTKHDIFFGTGPAMHEVKRLAEVAADSDSPVLITGETGTGKGMLAKWIHRNGKRANAEFIELNCSALRGEMLASELFGSQRGAFTSADRDRKGLLDSADRGTLFLDEIGDMSVDVQAQFLKVLEDKSYRRLGDVRLLRSDFRLICATHRDLASLIDSGTFRQDLLYRVNLIEIYLPPLRERRSDLSAIISYLLKLLGASDQVLTEQVRSLLLNYDWPGNIREMRNILERALLLTPSGSTVRQSLFSCLNGGRYISREPSPASRTVQQVEEAHIQAMLDQYHGNVDKAAKTLNISRATLYRRLKQIKDRTT